MVKLFVGIGGTGTVCLGSLFTKPSSPCIVFHLDTTASMASDGFDDEPDHCEKTAPVLRKEKITRIMDSCSVILMLIVNKRRNMHKEAMQKQYNPLREGMTQYIPKAEPSLQKLYRKLVRESSVHGKTQFRTGVSVNSVRSRMRIMSMSIVQALERQKQYIFGEFLRRLKNDEASTEDWCISELQTRKRVRLVHRRTGMSGSESPHLYDTLPYKGNTCAEKDPIKLCMDKLLRSRVLCNHMSKFVLSPTLRGQIGLIPMMPAA